MTEVEVDLGALGRNIRRVVDRIAPAGLMAVVKADAYGHGAIEVSRVAREHGVKWLGVLDGDTGQRLRDSGFASDIRMFAWLFSPDEDYASLVDADIDLGISHLHQLERVAESGAGRPARLHLKIDTGLHRNGSTARNWPALVVRALELRSAGIVELTGAWTHIAEASEAEDTLAIARFEHALHVAATLGAHLEVRHLAASAAGFARADARFDLVRTGAFLYGIAPGGGMGPADIGLEPVMTLRSTVDSLEPADGRMVARVATGWLDGVPAYGAGAVEVAIRGLRHPITRITAHHLDLDVPLSGASVGDVVTIFGTGASGEQTLQEWADALGTIGEEIVVGIPQRLSRRYIRS